MNYNQMFEFELRKLVEAEIARLTENLTNSASVEDYSDYKYQAGKISALRGVFDLCEEANTAISKR